MFNVTTTTWGPVYRYSSRQLWISYGVAVAVSTIASFIGLSAIYLSNASYSNKFSSVYRTAHSAKLNVTMRAEDMNATDPLPRYLTKATLFIATPNSAVRSVHGDDEKTALAATREVSSDTMIESGMKTAAVQDIELRIAHDFDPGIPEFSKEVIR
ncbi:hypothetical protein F5Y03DRAFT_395841 [Xylaria venustula]|nr:hypothetical protein F5Y03DRAFT_395841 [Xylaria venustula]